MVLVGDRGAEDGHDPVAGELVDGALEPGHGVGQDREEALHDLAPLLRVLLLGEVHRAADVGEQHRHLLALGVVVGRGSLTTSQGLRRLDCSLPPMLTMRSVWSPGASTGIGRATALRARRRRLAGLRRGAPRGGRRGAAAGGRSERLVAADPRRHRARADRRRRGAGRGRGRRRARRPRQQRRRRDPGPAGDDAARRLPPPDRGQPDRPRRGHPGDAAADPPAPAAASSSSARSAAASPSRSTGAYHAAKFGIEAVGDVFRQELRPWGISVSIVEPGSIDTPIWERGERNADEIDAQSPQTEALYGEAIEKLPQGRPTDPPNAASRRRRWRRRSSTRSSRSGPRSRYLVGLDAKVQARLKPLIPTPVFDRIVARQLDL